MNYCISLDNLISEMDDLLEKYRLSRHVEVEGEVMNIEMFEVLTKIEFVEYLMKKYFNYRHVKNKEVDNG